MKVLITICALIFTVYSTSENYYSHDNLRINIDEESNDEVLTVPIRIFSEDDFEKADALDSNEDRSIQADDLGSTVKESLWDYIEGRNVYDSEIVNISTGVLDVASKSNTEHEEYVDNQSNERLGEHDTIESDEVSREDADDQQIGSLEAKTTTYQFENTEAINENPSRTQPVMLDFKARTAADSSVEDLTTGESQFARNAERPQASPDDIIFQQSPTFESSSFIKKIPYSFHTGHTQLPETQHKPVECSHELYPNYSNRDPKQIMNNYPYQPILPPSTIRPFTMPPYYSLGKSDRQNSGLQGYQLYGSNSAPITSYIPGNLFRYYSNISLK